MSKPLAVGLTGGVASGKSAVERAFVALGVPVLDADVAAREAVQPPSPALAEIARRFGAELLLPDGTLDRMKLRERVFADPAARRSLESIVHPEVRRRMVAWREAVTAPYCVLSVPLLVEGGLDAWLDRVLVVDVPEAVQVERLRARDGIGEELARQMLAAQATRERRLAKAVDVLDNSGAPEVLPALVERLHRHYLRLAAAGTYRAEPLRLP